MEKIYRVKTAPDSVSAWFSRNFPGDRYTFNFYWYHGIGTRKVYGCEVFRDGKYHHNASQATAEEFETMVDWYAGSEEKRQETRDKLDNLKRWEMSLTSEERDAIARSVKSIEKQLSTLAGD